ncbi:MAG: SIR2 family protein, partial [Chloroflexi bacterium]|nr:SIR2 family protein [Chloroflexota bacterium]
MVQRRTIDEVVEAVRNAKNDGRSCTLLIGAGCSVTAEIPDATGFVKAIEEGYPLRYAAATKKTYAECMAQLHPGERRSLIAKFVDNAKINWEHLCIALLVQKGYVDRILTTNFDPLAVRACALLGEFPSVYDVAALRPLRLADIPEKEKVIYYLHGQRAGIVLFNTGPDFKKAPNKYRPIIDEAVRGRPLIVVGYSGESDPVFDALARVQQFEYGLYWIGHGESEPAKRVRERLLDADKEASYVSGLDAHGFLVLLTQKLGIFPPDFVAKPFTYLDGVFDMLTPYTIPGQTSQVPIAHPQRGWVASAREQHEGEPAAVALRLLMSANYDGVIALRAQYGDERVPELAEPLAWALLMQGNALLYQAETKSGEEADRLFTQAYDKYQQALQIKPDFHEALNNWGTALSDQAKAKSGEEADQLFTL